VLAIRLNVLLPSNCLQHRNPIAKTFKHPAYVKHSQGISQENLRELIYAFPRFPSDQVRAQHVNQNKKSSFFLYTSSEVFFYPARQ
jgi:hypothetical protein